MDVYLSGTLFIGFSAWKVLTLCSRARQEALLLGSFLPRSGQNWCWSLPLGPSNVSFMLYENPNSTQALESDLVLGPAHP